MNELNPKHPFASPVEVVEDAKGEQPAFTPGQRAVECAVSFLLGLSLMMLFCQLFVFSAWAENTRDVWHYPEWDDSEIQTQIWDDYDVTFFYVPALYWVGAFFMAIFGCIATIRSKCSLPSILMCVALIPLSVMGLFIAGDTGFAYW